MMNNTNKNILYCFLMIISSIILFIIYLDNRHLEGLLSFSIILFILSSTLFIIHIINKFNYRTKPSNNYINKKVICRNNIYFLEELNLTISKEYYILYAFYTIKDDCYYCVIKDNNNNKIKIKEDHLHLIFDI